MQNMIRQEDDMGCGVACVAFLAGITYRQAVDVLGQEKARTVGFRLQEIVDALDKFGLDYRFQHVKPKMKHSIYAEGTIVFINRSSRYPFGHYIVRHNGQWGDPWINLVRDRNFANAEAGFRKRLPGTPQWVVLRSKPD
jgi:hypothetical protein